MNDETEDIALAILRRMEREAIARLGAPFERPVQVEYFAFKRAGDPPGEGGDNDDVHSAE